MPTRTSSITEPGDRSELEAAGIAALVEDDVEPESGSLGSGPGSRPSARFDFRDVRIHTGGIAAEAAGSIRSSAFTVGSHIVLGAGAFTPGSIAGRQLLAHELTHVIQQQGSASGDEPRIARAPGGYYGGSPGVRKGRKRATPDPVVEYTRPARSSAPAFSKVETLTAHERELAAEAKRAATQIGKPLSVKTKATAEGASPQRSGYGARGGGRELVREILEIGKAIGHAFPENSSTDEHVPGQAAASHAEKLAELQNPGRALAVDRPMCDDCVSYLQKRAVSQKSTIVVQEPGAVWVFRPDGVQVGLTESAASIIYPPAGPGSLTASAVPTGLTEQLRAGATAEPVNREPVNPPAANREPERSVSERTETTARIGMPATDRFIEGGPSAKGEAIGAGVQILAQLKDWAMEKLGGAVEKNRLNSRWERMRPAVDRTLLEHPELGALVTVYWRIYRGNEGETYPTFLDLTVKYGTTEIEARESLEAIREASADEQSETQWIKPREPLPPGEYHTGFSKIAIATFATGRATLRNASWGGKLGGKFNQRGVTKLSIPNGFKPTFAILKPPDVITLGPGDYTTIDIDHEKTADGASVPVISDLEAVMVFPLDVDTLDVIGHTPQIKDSTGQLRGAFDLMRWVPVEDIQIISVLSEDVTLPVPTAEQKALQKQQDDFGAFVHEAAAGRNTFARGWRPATVGASEDRLRFSESGQEATLERLILWARRNHPRGLQDRTLLFSLSSSHEFSGSDVVRKQAADNLVLYLQGNQ